MSTQLPNQPMPQEEESLHLRELFSMCLSRWYWFLISLVVTLSVAFYYLLSTPPVYTRTASLLIKDDMNGKAGKGMAGVLSDIDIFQTSTNVNNEIQSLQSPSVMLDVVRRLRLNVSYFKDGRFYKRELYGRTLPYEVNFLDLQDNDFASMELHVSDAGLSMDNFQVGPDEYAVSVKAQLGDTVTTPAGRVVVQPASQTADSLEGPLYVTRSSMMAAMAAYASRLSVELADKDATVVTLSYADVNTQRAEDLLSTLIAVYNETWVKDKNQIAVSTSMFINERLGVIEQELGNVDENISSYKSRNLLPDVQAAAGLYMTQSSEMGTQIMQVNTQLSMARYIRNYLANTSSENQLIPANSGIESSAIERQISEYNAMQLRRNDLVSSSSERNPLVADMDESLRGLRSAIMTSVDNHIASLQAQLRTLQQSEQQTTARLAANPTQGKYLLSVERQQKVKEALYLFLLQKREENELSQAFTAYNTRIITPPMGSMTPSSPASRKVMLIAFAIGLLIPVGVIFARERLNTKVRGRKDLEGLTLPFAGEIPVSDKTRKNKSQRVLIIKHGQNDMMGEAFRVLRTNLEFMLGMQQESGHAGVTIITSFNPGSGKTFITMNTAAAFSLKGKRVLVVDGDLRHGSASAFVGSPASGLSDYLAQRVDEWEDLVVPVNGYEGFCVMPAGTIPPNPTELLAGARMNQFLTQAAEAYDVVLVDCPPVEIVADTQIIAQRAYRTLFVVRVGLLERDMLPQIQRAYDDKRYAGMAIVLNGTDVSGSRYGSRYGYKYGYGHKYGSADEK